MITAREVVEKIIADSPFVEEVIARGLLNLSAYAREIRPIVEARLSKPVTEGSVVMALKRLQPEAAARQQNAAGLLRQISDITVRSGLVESTFLNSSTLIECESKLLSEISRNPDQVVAISQGIRETTLLTQQSVDALVGKIFRNERLLLRLDGVSSITVKLPPENVDQPGIYYLVLKALAWNDINLTEIISTANEMTIVVADTYVERAFSVLKQITRL